MKKDKLRVLIIAAVIVVAVVGGLLSLKIEPAHAPSTPTPMATPSESLTPSEEPTLSPVPETTPEADSPTEEEETPTPEPVKTATPSEEPTETPVQTEEPSEVLVPTPAPSVTPTPEPSEEPTEPEELVCTVEIRCDTLLDPSVVENEAILPYIPADGVVLAKTEVAFEEGDSAFDVLNRVTRENNIQMEFRKDGAYSGNYIEGIGYLYEMDAGPLSGWMYKVNEKFPNYGCSRYEMQPGDEMVWLYTCDLGRDVGDNSEW